MSDVFISHVRKDSDIAQEIARGLEAAGYTTWYYERDSVAGVSYLLTTKQAIEESRGVLVIISSHSLGAPQMTKEVVRAHESDKPFIPVLRGVTHDEFQQRQPEWREAMGAAASLDIPAAGASAILPRVIDGLKALGIHPKSAEERAAEAKVRERAQRLEAILRQADQATEGEDWDKAVAALNEYLSLAPGNGAIQERLLEAQRRQRNSRLAALRAQAAGLTKAEKWEQALSAWRGYLALEPEDKEAAQAELQQAEKQSAMAGAYGEAQAALAKKDYDRAITLLKGLIVQDEAYKQASRLLANAIELRRGGGQRGLARWLRVGLAGVAVIGLALVLTRVLPSLVPGGRKPTPSSTAIAATPTALGPTVVGAAAPSPTRVLRPTNTPPRVPTATPTPRRATATPSPVPVAASTVPTSVNPCPNPDVSWPMLNGGPTHCCRLPFAGPAHAEFAEQCGFYQIGFKAGVAIAADGTRYEAGVFGDWLRATNAEGEKWTTRFSQLYGSVPCGTTPAIGSDGTVYVGSDEGYFYAVSPEGNVKWRFTAGQYHVSSAAIASDGSIYFISGAAVLYAVDADGKLMWKYSGVESVTGSPAVGEDGTVYVAGSQVYAFDPAGTLKWQYRVQDQVYSSPLVTQTGPCCVDGKGTIYAFTSDGNLRWSLATGDLVYGSPALGLDGTIYVHSAKTVHAVSQDGELKWTYHSTNIEDSYIRCSGEGTSPRVDIYGTVYVPCGYPDVCALDPNGKFLGYYRPMEQ
jgi:outer membrane protein assembly factor BamB